MSTTINQQSVSSAAAPYAITSLSAGVVGAVVAVAALTAGSSFGLTIAAISGIAVSFFGAGAFFATIYTACTSKSSSEFYERIGPMFSAIAGGVVATMIARVAEIALNVLIFRLFSRR